MRLNVVFAGLFVFLLLTTSFALAAGSSTDTSDDSDTVSASDASVDDNADCDVIADRRSRIECKLRAEKEEYSSYSGRRRGAYESKDYVNDIVPEACKRLGAATDTRITSKEQCRELYNELQECYSMSGIEKPLCFKRHAGFEDKPVGEATPKQARQYVVALLYDIQERVEQAHLDGNIDDTTASEIVALIVEIKEDLLNGESRDVVKPKIDNLKSLLRAARQASAEVADE